jgi:hypothetical protein
VNQGHRGRGERCEHDIAGLHGRLERGHAFFAIVSSQVLVPPREFLGPWADLDSGGRRNVEVIAGAFPGCTGEGYRVAQSGPLKLNWMSVAGTHCI